MGPHLMVEHPDGRTGNRILDALPADVRRRLSPALRSVDLRVRTVLWEPGQPIVAVHFPVSVVVSLVTPVSDGSVVEVATVGNEGVVGVPAALGSGIATIRALVQVRGTSLRMSAADFDAEMQCPGPFRMLVQSYLPALFSHVAQVAACSRLHSAEERLSRLLLMTHDRVGADRFEITQEYLAQMLGSRRPTVTVAAGILQKEGLISYRRGRMVILDRAGLETASCECYAVIRDVLEQCLSRATRVISPGSGRGAAPTPA